MTLLLGLGLLLLLLPMPAALGLLKMRSPMEAPVGGDLGASGG